MAKIAILGFGTVGSGVYEVLCRNAAGVSRRAGEPVEVKYILDPKDFSNHPAAHLFIKNFDTILEDPEIRVVVETIGGTRFAYPYVKACLESGRSVCTSNKEMVATYGAELLGLAKAHNCAFLLFEIWGSVVKSDKDAKITATLGVYNKWSGDTFTFFGKDGKEYTILKNYDGVAGSYTVFKSSNSSNGVRFYTNSNGQLQNSKVVLNGKVYQIVDSFGEMNFVPDGGTAIITGDEYRDVKAVLDNILTQMGFEYSGRAYITDKLITKNLGTIVEGSASLTYPTGYVQELVTDDPSVKPPQTGDNASVVGFVMIAIALVAAAAVTVKKVRA